MAILVMAGPADAQPPASDSAPQQEAAPATETMDVFDLWRSSATRKRRRSRPWDYRKPMMAFAPVIGAKPSSGVLLGAAGNVAFFRGDPATTSISSLVASLTFSTKKQTSLTNRVTMFAAENRWRVDGGPAVPVDVARHLRARHERRHARRDPGRFRFLQAASHGLLPAAPCAVRGRGPVFRQSHRGRPRDEEDAAWPESPYVDLQRGPGPPTGLADRGGHEPRPPLGQSRQFHQRRSRVAGQGQLSNVVRRVSRRRSSWQKLNLDVRTYSASRATAVTRSRSGGSPIWSSGEWRHSSICRQRRRHLWPSARGYTEGQFRGERLAYGEIEYRGTLMRNGLLGMVAFLNTTTVTNLDSDERSSTASPQAAAPGCACSSTSDRRPTCASTSVSASRDPRASTWPSRRSSSYRVGHYWTRIRNASETPANVSLPAGTFTTAAGSASIQRAW